MCIRDSDVDELIYELREIAMKKPESENMQMLTKSEYKKKLKEHIGTASEKIYRKGLADW